MKLPWSLVLIYSAFVYGAWIAATGYGWRALVGGACTWMVVAPLLRRALSE